MESGSGPASSLLHYRGGGRVFTIKSFTPLASRSLIQSWLIGMTVDSRTILPAKQMMGNLLSAFPSLCPLGRCLSDCLAVIFCLSFCLPSCLLFFHPSLKAFVCVSYCVTVSVGVLILSRFHLLRPASEPSKNVAVSSCNNLASQVYQPDTRRTLDSLEESVVFQDNP